MRDALDNIYDARIPQIWKAKSWESTTLGFWFTELIERNQQFSQWLYHGRPAKFWMTGFFNPQGIIQLFFRKYNHTCHLLKNTNIGFLTAMRQEVTRMHKGWALDNVTLHNEVTKFTPDEIRTPPSVRDLFYLFNFL